MNFSSTHVSHTDKALNLKYSPVGSKTRVYIMHESNGPSTLPRGRLHSDTLDCRNMCK